MQRQKRLHSSREQLRNVRRARRFTERYGVAEAHPDDYMKMPAETKADWDALLDQIK